MAWHNVSVIELIYNEEWSQMLKEKSKENDVPRTFFVSTQNLSFWPPLDYQNPQITSTITYDITLWFILSLWISNTWKNL